MDGGGKDDGRRDDGRGDAGEQLFIEHFLPEDNPEREFLFFMSRFNTMMGPLAFLLSYARNRDVKWAFVHGLLGAPYVAFTVVDTFFAGTAEELLTIHEELTGSNDGDRT